MAVLTKRILPDGSVVEVAVDEPSRLTLAEQNVAEQRMLAAQNQRIAAEQYDAEQRMQAEQRMLAAQNQAAQYEQYDAEQRMRDAQNQRTAAEQNAAEGRAPIDLTTLRAIPVTGTIRQVVTSAGAIPIAQSKSVYEQPVNPYPAPLPAAGGSMLDSIPVWAIVGAAALAAFVLLKK